MHGAFTRWLAPPPAPLPLREWRRCWGGLRLRGGLSRSGSQTAPPGPCCNATGQRGAGALLCTPSVGERAAVCAQASRRVLVADRQSVQKYLFGACLPEPLELVKSCVVLRAACCVSALACSHTASALAQGQPQEGARAAGAGRARGGLQRRRLAQRGCARGQAGRLVLLQRVQQAARRHAREKGAAPSLLAPCGLVAAARLAHTSPARISSCRQHRSLSWLRSRGRLLGAQGRGEVHGNLHAPACHRLQGLSNLPLPLLTERLPVFHAATASAGIPRHTSAAH